MIKNLISSLYKAYNYKGSVQEKSEVFLTLNRLKGRQSRKLKKNEIIRDSILKYSVSAYDYWSLHYLFSEIFINKEYDFEPDTKSPLIIDCGANIGMATLYFKMVFPGAKIIAFEPNPNSFSLLKKNMEENNLDKVELYNLGLAGNEGEIPFYIDTYNPGTLIGSVKQKRGGPGELKVQTSRLSAYIAEHEHVDLVKMDVEGAELEIIEELSASGMMARVKEFIVEYHHNIPGEKPDLSHFLSLFEAEGFFYNIKTGFSNLKSFQDILIHFYRIKNPEF